MSVRFKPPIAAERDVHWRDLVAIGPDDDPFWARVREAQFGFLWRYLPFVSGVAVCLGAVVLGSLARHIPPILLLAWAVANLVLVASWVLRSVGAWQTRRPPTVPRRRLLRLLGELGIIGLAWGLVFLAAIPAVADGQRTLALATALCAVGVNIFATVVFPLAALMLAGPMALGTLAGVLLARWPDGTAILVVLASFLLVALRGVVLTSFAFLTRLRTQDRLVEQEEVVRLLLNEFEANGSDWLFEFDERHHLTFVSQRFAEAARSTVDELLGRRWVRLFPDRRGILPLFRAVVRRQPFRDLVVRVRLDGEDRFWSLSGTPKIDAHGRYCGYRGVGSDITERQRSAERIAELATFDSLTGLVNRRIVHTAIADGLHGPTGVAILFVDLDRFKSVNDSLGHAMGDRLLAEVAQRLRTTVGAEGQIGRLGGDEFAVVLRSANAEAAIQLGDRIIAALSAPFDLDGTEVRIGASVGLALGPEDGASVEALMRAADLALYEVKGKGRGSVRRYDREMHARAEARRALELDLRVALERREIRLVYQPIVNALDERIVGFEALMRWRHPRHGDVPPSIFIPMAEESGLIAALGRFALVEATAAAARWPAPLKLSVNLSPLQVEDPEIVSHVREALARSGLDPRRLELELTESVLLDSRESVAQTLSALRALGCSFALDDFGTGYSSLGYLQKLAFNRIKIDRSFVRASVEDGESTAIIQAIVALAERLGMETTAEGTETRAEFEAMRRLGCGQVQGYYFGRPMEAGDVDRLIRRTRPLLDVEPAGLDLVAAALADPIESGAPAEDPLSPPDPPPTPAAANGRSPAAAEPASPRARRAPLSIPAG
ncbi:MAG: EAL domain-containing protein [Sphingomonadaceae bacterium]|uniref:putative bifunctional diguanylate cyclase/phosphodiesterase n=1 Tax=Thermaurantiacus sp. TaxID=2820283 RepID=UPI00298EFB97|nr:EAL domain-containing protein [Thermaurantiacus sp.]MCS6985883.1 EAL domain-containing protein [Sphingomonadaceae bacterium]MDW8413848.1 EAL domain-containing protein [Thermaurantiacus sp.]